MSAPGNGISKRVPAWLTPEDPPKGALVWSWLKGVSLALAVAGSLLVLQRLDAALSSLISIRDVGGAQVADHSVPGGLYVDWCIATACGLIALAVLVHPWMSTVSVPLRRLVRTILVMWFVWALLGLDLLLKQTGHWYVWGGDSHEQSARSVLRLLAVLLIALIMVARKNGLDDMRDIWSRASVIRVQLILLGLLVGLIYLIPMTSAQAIDVLRAWTDSSLVRVCCAGAAAILLGAVVRDSCTSLLGHARPGSGSTADEERAAVVARSRAAEAPSEHVTGRVVEAILVVLGTVAVDIVWHWTVVPVIGVTFAVWRLTSPAEPLPFRSDVPRDGDTADRDAAVAVVLANVRRLARFLACVPILTLFVGLVVATTDSFLIRGPSKSGDFELLGITVIAGLISALLLLHAGVRTPSTPPWTSVRGRWVLPAIAFVVVAGCGLAGSAGIVFALAFLVLAIYLALASEADDSVWLERRCGLGAFLGAAVAVYLQPVRGADAIGTFGAVMLAMVGLLLALHGLAHLAARRKFRGVPAEFLPLRVPIVTLLGLWILAAFAWGPDGFHQARTIDTANAATTSASAPTGPTSFRDAVSAWLDARAHEKARPDDLNMVLVAAAGGGEKVAFWTDLVLDCALSDPVQDGPGTCDGAGKTVHADRIFLTSSVSGGSVGIYRYLTSLAEVRRGDPWPGNADAAWSADATGDRKVPKEVLSPVAAWGLFHDMPVFLLGVPTNPVDCTGRWSCRYEADRAVVQEEAVAEPFHAKGEKDWFAASEHEPVATSPSPIDGEDGAPIAVFNGSIDGGIGRVLIAPFRLARPYDPTGTCLPLSIGAETGSPRVPGAIDAHDLIARNQQIPLVTAALLTARFPVVSPPGRLGTTTSSGASGCSSTSPLPDIRVRDGGYMENSGLLTIVNLLPALRYDIGRWMRTRRVAARNAHRKLRPFRVHIVVVSIDDDATTLDPKPTTFTQQSAGPEGIQAQASSDYLTRLARDPLTSGALPNVTYLQISPPPTVGAHAATGWELSSTTRERHLVAALTPAQPNEPERIARQHLLVFRCLLADGRYALTETSGPLGGCTPPTT